MAVSKTKKPSTPPGPIINVDAWTLKCLYNQSDYAQRIASGEFVPLHEESSKWRADGERTIQVYYGRPSDRFLMVRLQWFENEQGEITRSGMKEPKHLYLNGIDYHAYGGNRWWERLRRDPTGLWPDTKNDRLIAAKKAYGAWRRFKCDQAGPIEAWWRSRWFTSRPYGAYRNAVERVVVVWRRTRKRLKPLRSRVRRFFSGSQGHAVVLA
jgi:hypothetical protein